ncbi:MFS transporter [Actinorhabdospora filicis]|uniref:MFS transporter n=1 Tax=Actinorhabdospora filicis TaxID=1785913 RepID=A0A9W6SSD3_9ACTN|nr:MFS transporter [Actinorhabdospora filicis]GLZ81556.1 MFS transporter [Actinorhabdospora filicis]
MPAALLRRVVHERPEIRVIAAASLANTVGAGMLMPLSAIYFTGVVGLPVAQVALALGVASCAGMLAAVPLGHLGDRLGARNVLVGLLLGIGAIIACYLLVDSIWLYAPLVTAAQILDRGVAGVAAALIAEAVPGAAERTRARAHLRSVVYTGLAIGTGLSALVLALGDATAARIGIAADAATCVLAALLYLRLPARPPHPAGPRPSPWRAVRDLPYLGMIALFSVLGVVVTMTTFALPLWISADTAIPRVAIPAVFVANTAANMLAQVPVARRVGSRAAAVRAAVIAGAALAVACLLLAATAGTPPLAASALLAGAVAAMLTGSLCANNALFYLSTDLAPADAQGQYQGLVAAGTALAAMIGPGVLTALPLARGAAGWAVLAAVFAAAGIGVAATARAMRERRAT